MKQWSRWSLKEGVPQWDMFPGLTELRLIGCSIELIWTPKSKSSTSPKTNSLTCWPREISRVMSGIICCACSISAISVLQCALIQWQNDLNKIQEKNESQQSRDLWWILLPGRHRSYRLQLQEARWREVMEVKIHGVQLLRKRTDWDDLMKAQIYLKPPIITTMSNAWKSFSSASYSNLDDDRAWSSQLWRTEIKTYDRSVRPDKISWRMVRKVRPGHEEILLDGTAQSARKEGRNTSWQIGATWWYQFLRTVMASTNCNWKRYNRIGIVCRIKIIRESGEWSSAEKTENNFQCYRRWRKAFYDLENVHGCNDGINSIHGKELPEQLSLYCKHDRSHTQTNVRHIYEISDGTRGDFRFGVDWFKKPFMEIHVVNWWWKDRQSSTHEDLRLFGFCGVLGRFYKILNLTMHGSKD